MLNIISAIYHDAPISLGIVCNLEDPRTAEERRIVTQLRGVDEAAAEALMKSISALADKQAEEVFCSGVRFGSQLAMQLLEEI